MKQTLWGFGTMLQDAHLAWRCMRREPALFLGVIAMLAVGMGMAGAMFSVTSQVVWRPLPFSEPDNLVCLKQFSGTELTPYVSARDLKNLAEASRTLDLGAYIRRDANVRSKLRSFRARVAVATAPLFRNLGTRAASGRILLDEDDRPGAERVSVLSHEFWVSQFAAGDSVIGKQIALDGEPYRVVGVLEAGFRLPNSEGDRFDIWIPGALDSKRWGTRPVVIVRAIGRLRPGSRLPQANSELAAFDVLQRGRPRRIVAVNWASEVRRSARTPVLLMIAAIGIVFLICCVNAANLLLARALARGREVGIRYALGAPRGRIVRQMLTESVVLSTSSALIGLALAFFGKDLLVTALSERVGVLGPASMDLRALALTMALGIGAGILSGLAPALQLTSPGPIECLNEIGRGATGSSTSARFRRSLVMAEVALAMMAMVSAATLLRSLTRLGQVDCGYNAKNVMVGSVDLDPVRFRTAPEQAAFASTVIERLSRAPGVVSAAVSSDVPLGGMIYSVSGLEIDGQSVPVSIVGVVSPRYFETLGIPVLYGRDFARPDAESAPEVAIVNHRFARMYCGGRSCVGKFINRWLGGNVSIMIVGEVGDTRYSPEDNIVPEVYRPISQESAAHQEILIRTSGKMDGVLASLMAVTKQIDWTQPVHDASTLDARQFEFFAPRRILLEMAGILAALALALASAGTMAVLYHDVSQQRRSIAIQMAIGAGPRRIVLRQIGSGLQLICGGAAVGVLLGAGLSRLIRSELWGAGTEDGTAWVMALGVTGATGFLACLAPALEALRMDIAQVLRED